jgi:predicted dehydrogenase
MLERSGLPEETPQFDDWREMIDAVGDPDGLVVTTPNYLHAAPAIYGFETHLPVALEKPLAASPEDCDRILLAERDCDGRSLLGFVLRSTPFYSTVQKLVRDGAIGRVLSIQADELVGWAVTSIMNRSPWRRHQALSGGAMLEKCCHDLDLLNWLMDCRPVALNSFGGRRILNPNPTVGVRCDDCVAADDCVYFKEPQRAAHEDEAEQQLHQFIRDEAICIYNTDADIMDNQSVQIEYENGAVANFLMCFHCAGERAGRNIHLVGTHGRIWGNLHDNKVYWQSTKAAAPEVYDTRGDGSGHGGGDRLHALLLHQMMADPTFRPEQNVQAGYLSAAMCFAADRSVAEGRRLRFSYLPDGRVEAV